MNIRDYINMKQAGMVLAGNTIEAGGPGSGPRPGAGGTGEKKHVFYNVSQTDQNRLESKGFVHTGGKSGNDVFKHPAGHEIHVKQGGGFRLHYPASTGMKPKDHPKAALRNVLDSHAAFNVKPEDAQRYPAQ